MAHILDEHQISKNYETLRKFINATFEGDRLDKLNKMYDHFMDRMITAPASSKEHFHNAFAGGYVEHILNICMAIKKVKQVWTDMGADINFTDEEMFFSALHHDLGKLGDLNNNYYIPNDSSWHIEHQGKIYKNNPDLNYLAVPDRAVVLLNHFGITITEHEFLGIKLADGLYDEGNKSYFISYSKDFELKTNLPHIIHQADMMVSKMERDKYYRIINNKKQTTKNVGGRPTKKQKLQNVKMPKKLDFKSIFGDVDGPSSDIIKK
jgi:hypothetical protein